MSRFSQVIFVVGILVAVVTCAGGGSNLPACYSTTNEYIVTTMTIATKPLSPTLIQRYVGNQLTIYCMSFSEFGPSCTPSVPQLCYRAVADATAAFTCESLTDYVTNPQAQIVRGDQAGPSMIWLVKWDGSSSSTSVTCFPRQVEIRLLAFVNNNWQSNTTIFALLLILAIISVLLISFALYSYIRTRYYQIDYSGATTIAGPQPVFRGPQIAVEPQHATQKSVTTVYLPVRDNAALNDMTTSRVGQMLADPNTPRHSGAIYLEDDTVDGRIPRGPGGSSIRRRRASPPAPGDGIQDPVFAQRLSEARRVRSLNRLGRHGGAFAGDDDAIDEMDDNFDAIGAARRRLRGMHQGADSGDDDYSPSGSRSRNLNRSGSKRNPQNRSRGDLFPTQREFMVSGGGGDDVLQPYTRNLSYEDEQLDIQEDDGTGKPTMAMPGGQPVAGKQNIRYVPQWMLGSFGRGGVIPEAGDGSEGQPGNEVPEDYFGDGMLPPMSRGGRGGDTSVAKRFYQPTVDQENTSMAGGAGSRDTPIKSSKFGGPNNNNDPQSGAPRSALKRRSSNQQYESGAESDDALRRGVSFRGDYVRDGSAGGDGVEGAPAGARSFRMGNQGRQAASPNQDNFSRNKAKVHNRSLQLDPASGNGQRLAHNGSRSGDPSAGGERLIPIGVDANGSEMYSNNGNASGAAPGTASYECEACRQPVYPGSKPAFCPVSGLRHH